MHRRVRHPCEVQKRHFWLVLKVCLGLAASSGRRAVNRPANDMCDVRGNCLDTLLSDARVLKLPVGRRRKTGRQSVPAGPAPGRVPEQPRWLAGELMTPAGLSDL